MAVAVAALMGTPTGLASATPATATAPTDGWQQKSFTYSMHKPWNLDLDERYRYDSAAKTHTMWVYSTDEPLEEGSSTDPRTEMRWNQEYT
ncbi:cinnamyl alcohol dehydrogenase, partial [Streptomyces sp. 2MCAF27]